jgi:hypothetical protein
MIKVLRGSEGILLEILKTLKRQNEPHSGKTWGAQPTLKVNQPALELYFIAKYVGDIVLPQGQLLYLPRQPFRRLILLNEGNADIKFDTNYKPGDMQQTSLLRAQEDIQIDATGPEPIWSFSAIAVTAGGPAPQLNQTNWGNDQTTAHLRMVAIT